MNPVLSIIKDESLTFNQRFTEMAKQAENSYDPITLSPDAEALKEMGIVWDMGEGKAPYRPRYIIPDYDRFMQQGSEFLMLDAPQNIWDAVNALCILYHHVPGASGTPVYMGHVDRMLEPFVKDEKEAKQAIRVLLTHLDRTIPDAFCHCDIGPVDTKAGRIILELSAEMQRPVPNMSMIYSEETSDEFAIKAIECGLECAKPSFVNDRMYAADWGSGYAVASCYNVLPIGGGGFTLGRLNMKKLGEAAKTPEALLDEWLPRAAAAQCEWMDKRIQFIVDEAKFFKNHLLVHEGLIEQDKFVGMFGLAGFAECINTVLGAKTPEESFGANEKANELAEQVLNKLADLVEAYEPKYGKFYLHAQVGVDNDKATTPGTRIPIGHEMDLPAHLAVTAKMQKRFPTGTGDLYPMEITVKNNPSYVLDVIKGAFAMDMRYFSFYSEDTDVIRVTGYLVKRSDVERLRGGGAVLDNSTKLGSNAFEAGGFLNRRVRSLNNS